MDHSSCVLMWWKHFLVEIAIDAVLPMSVYGDNQFVIHIASNPIFHEKTKHIEMDC